MKKDWENMTHWITRIVEQPTMDATSASKADVATIGRQVSYEWLNIYHYDGAYESDQSMFSRIDGITAAVKPGNLVVYQYPHSERTAIRNSIH